MVQLSIIIPCYNSFHRLKTALDCLIKVNVISIEVIIIDDCSIDNSFYLLNQYVSDKKNVIKVFQTTKNSGPGIARNIGISNANGKYLCFLDSDDNFSGDFYDVISDYLKKDLDCIVYDAEIIKNEDKYFLPMILGGINGGIVSTTDAIVYTRGAPWGKIYKTQIVKENNIHFLDTKKAEDTPFTKTALSYCKRIEYIKKPLYHYIMNDSSLMHISNYSDNTNIERCFEYIESIIGMRYPRECEAIFSYEYLYASGLLLSSNSKRSEWCSYITKIERLYPNYLSNPYIKKYPTYVRLTILCISLKLFSVVKFLSWLRAKTAK